MTSITVPINVSNTLLSKYCAECNYQTAEEVNSDELKAWLEDYYKNLEQNLHNEN